MTRFNLPVYLAAGFKALSGPAGGALAGCDGIRLSVPVFQSGDRF